MIQRCECGSLIYSSDQECPHCGRRLEFGSDDARKLRDEEQLDLFSKKKERQKRLFKC